MNDKTETRLRAEELGIKSHHNANDATIQKQIDAYQEANPAEEGPELFAGLTAEECQPMTQAEYDVEYPESNKNSIGNKRKQCAKLIRCRIQNMNPLKREWPGEIISVGSARLGTWKKFVPFNSSDPYHLPQIIFDMLIDKKCTVFHTEKDERGNSVRKGRLVNEYAIEVLDPLTPDELNELARTQALQAGQQ